ncbi:MULTISPECIES: LysR substrate-binding domain-containing protein [Pseudomonas]|uniref:LysR family transcription regulator protein n=2 Tax=Pseudomonas amygdali TaxID=47877 RepID=A0A0Q0AUZ2_PSEAJ|nr:MULTISPECIES: LysR substrate-binding domain-containing protein [Pseudomonas]KPX62374.1 LysR family transcription regulator protein [Pseudomonas amygdali pv. lachrymans]MEE4914958.1 LysR substrate-binding domain-containing protein [Pseudomonas alliivorans]KPB30056.1 LysR family transcription regulator protein [Pseudomonas syringae pv. syringae]KPY78945.1 LysR family transcription regulator protein [Pseudomonas amygdali pv. tabaci]MDU8630181.1 LysR substrate-binding domain-containing protein 
MLSSNAMMARSSGCTKAHAGILIQPLYIIYNEIVSGELIPVLTEWELPKLIINIAFHERTYIPAKTRLFIDFLVEKFKPNNFERLWNEV